MSTTRIRTFYTSGSGEVRLIITRDCIGGQIEFVELVKDYGTNREINIPTDIKDDEALEQEIKAIKGSRGVEAN